MRSDRNHPLHHTDQEIGATLSRYRTSGMGLDRFARAHGIPLGRLHYWLYQKQTGGCSKRRIKPTKPAGVPVFQEIKLTARSESVATWAAEVSLPRGIAVRFSPVATAEWIGSVVQALQRPC